MGQQQKRLSRIPHLIETWLADIHENGIGKLRYKNKSIQKKKRQISIKYKELKDKKRLIKSGKEVKINSLISWLKDKEFFAVIHYSGMQILSCFCIFHFIQIKIFFRSFGHFIPIMLKMQFSCFSKKKKKNLLSSIESLLSISQVKVVFSFNSLN